MTNKFIIYLTIIISTALITQGCKPKSVEPKEKTALELQLEALMNNGTSWGLNGGTVMKDDYDVTSQFAGFTLTIGEFTYTTQNALATTWPSTGTWQFVNDNPSKVVRDDGIEIDVTPSNGQLKLSFSVTNLGGKITGINGIYEFFLTSN